jgi:hypothetical protein
MQQRANLPMRPIRPSGSGIKKKALTDWNRIQIVLMGAGSTGAHEI